MSKFKVSDSVERNEGTIFLVDKETSDLPYTLAVFSTRKRAADWIKSRIKIWGTEKLHIEPMVINPITK